MVMEMVQKNNENFKFSAKVDLDRMNLDQYDGEDMSREQMANKWLDGSEVLHDGLWVYGWLADDYMVGQIIEASEEGIMPSYWVPILVDTVEQFTGFGNVKMNRDYNIKIYTDSGIMNVKNLTENDVYNFKQWLDGNGDYGTTYKFSYQNDVMHIVRRSAIDIVAITKNGSEDDGILQKLSKFGDNL